MYIRKRIHPCTLPCGTPDITAKLSDVVYSNTAVPYSYIDIIHLKQY